jgi:16S rRNA G1207 methylase RsmC
MEKFNLNNKNGSTKLELLHLSDQALGAIMMALQNSLLNQTDIVPVLKNLKLANHPSEGLIVTNPPVVRTGETIETSVQ